MNETQASLRRTLRSTSIVGGATVAALAFGLARAKFFALMLGPVGVGLFGILVTLANTGTAIAGFNLQTSAVRSLASTEPNTRVRTEIRAALWTLTWFCAGIGATGFFAFVRYAYVPSSHVSMSLPGMLWLTATVVLGIVGASQLAELQAEGRIGDVACVRLWGGLLGVIGGITAVAIVGETALYQAVILVPLSSLVVSTIYFLRIPRRPWPRLSEAKLGAHWGAMLRIGAGVTLGMLANGVGQLILRSVIVKLGGLDAAGLFQAAATVSSANLAIVLSALAVDYLPRLSAATNDRQEFSIVFNDQLRVALLLVAPALTAICAFAPWVIQLLFSRAFLPATPLLQWMLVGDLLKIITWCCGYVVLARGATTVFVIGELAFQLVSIAIAWILYPFQGTVGIGVGYLMGYAVVMIIYGGYTIRGGVTINRSLIGISASVAAAIVLIAVVSIYSRLIGMAAGAIVTSGLAFLALRLLHDAGVVHHIRAMFAR